MTYFPDFDFKSIPLGPCDGFARTYISLCLLHNISPRDDIIWFFFSILFIFI